MKLVIKNSGKNKRLYIQKSIRKNGKCTSMIVESLGILSSLCESMNMSIEEVIKWGEDRAEMLTKNERDNLKEVIIKLSKSSVIKANETRTYRCGQLFLQDIYSKLRFKNTFRNIKSRNNYEYDAEAIFSDLIFSRIIEPGSKQSSYDTAKTFIEPLKYDKHHIYRALSLFSKEMDYILSETYFNSNFVSPRNNRVLYYDRTNYYFEIEDEDGFRNYGKCKENKPNPIVQMGLFMDGDGIPLSFFIFEGNKNEQLSLRPLEEKIIKDFDLSKIVVCTDAGLASKNNKFFNSFNGRSYIVTQSLKKLKKDDKKWALNKDDIFYELGSNLKVGFKDFKEDRIYYKEEPLSDTERLIVTYSPKYAKYQKKIRDKQVNLAIKKIETGNIKRSKSNPNDPSRFISKVGITDDGEVASHEVISLDYERISMEEMYDGFYGITTNLEDDARDIITVNERRWEIEESFRILKTDFEARPVYLRRKERIEAHFLICFMALLIYRILEKKLNYKYTNNEIIETLRNYNHLKIEGAGYIPEFKRTKLTDDLEQIFNLGLDREIITPSSMRSIVSKTKKVNKT